MYKTMIASVSGNTATDVTGRRLKVISNQAVYPGAVVYTDGAVVYGWDWTNDQYVVAPKKRTVAGVPLYVAGPTSTSTPDDLYKLTALKEPYSSPESLDVSITPYAIPLWSGRPPFFNDKKEFYSLRGSWESPRLYKASKGTAGERVTGRRLLLGIDDRKGFIWQAGHLCQTKDTLDNTEYYYITSSTSGQTKTYAVGTKTYSQYGSSYVRPPSGINGYPCYSLQNDDLSDLRIIYGRDGGADTTVRLSPIVSNILSRIRAYVDGMAAATVPPSTLVNPLVPYPDVVPDTTQLGYCLGADTLYDDDYYGVMNYGFAAPYHYWQGLNDNCGSGRVPPCDNLTAKGGNPLYSVDFSNYSEYTSSEANNANGYNKRYKTIHNVHFVGNVLYFDLCVYSTMIWYPYKETLTPVSGYTYNPALPAGGDAYLWMPCRLRYVGWWRVAYHAGSYTVQEISHKINEPALDSGYYPDDVVYNGSSVDLGDGYAVNYTYDATTGYLTAVVRCTYDDDYGITHTATVLTLRDSSSAELCSVRAIVKLAEKECLVFTRKYIYHIKNNSLLDTIEYLDAADYPAQHVYTGKVVNDSFTVNKNVARLKKFYDLLANIPYYS